MLSANKSRIIYLVLAQLFGFLLDICTYSRRSERHKDLQILVLRQPLRILQRQNAKPLPVSLFEMIASAVLAVTLVRLLGGAHTYINQVAMAIAGAFCCVIMGSAASPALSHRRNCMAKNALRSLLY
jgi:hypothetical protein